MYVYLELFKVLVLLGIVMKALGGRFWAEAVVAAVVIYAALGLSVVGIFHRGWPLMTSVDPRVVIFGEVVACGVAYFAGARRHVKGTPGREVADLFALSMVITGVEIVMAVALA